MDAVFTRDRLEPGEGFETRLARDLVGGDRPRLVGTLPVGIENRCLDRDDLRVEAALCDCACCTELRFEPQGVGIPPRDAVLLGDALGPLKLAGEFVVLVVAPRDGFAVSGFRASNGVGADRQPAHVLDPAGEHDVFYPRGDQAVGQVGGFLRRAALGIDGDAGHRLGTAVGKPGGAGDVHRLGADLVDTAADDLSHVRGANPGAPEHAGEDLTQTRRSDAPRPAIRCVGLPANGQPQR